MSKLVAVVRRSGTDEIVDALMTQHMGENNENFSARLLNLWPPFMYYVETMITDELHSYFSQDEIQRIGMFAQANAEEKPINEPPARRIKCDFSDPRLLRRTKRILLRCFENNRDNVAIVTGEAHYKIYDNAVYDAITLYASDAQNKPKFVCGPVLLINDTHHGNRAEGSIVLRLWKAGKLDLWYSDVRQAVHFRLGGTDTLYIEEPHIAGAQMRFGWLFENNNEVGLRFKKTMEHVINRQNVRRSKDPLNDFLLLTSSELAKVIRVSQEELASGRKAYYDEYTKQDLDQIIKQYQILKE